jgi:lauroyl/myristoyl acyltransferase
MIRTKNRILAIIRSNDRLDNVVLNRFIIRHTNEDVYLAYFRINKEVEKVIRAYIDEWLSLYLKGARLIETV